MPQFRTLVYVSHNDRPSLSAMAGDLGLSLPAASRMVEGLVKRRLVVREARSSDRRCVSLALTTRGEATFRAALAATQLALARRFHALSGPELAVVSQAMGILGQLFASAWTNASPKARTRCRSSSPPKGNLP